MIKRFIQLLKAIRSQDPEQRFKILYHIGKRIAPAYRFRAPNMHWWDDKVFNQYLQKFDQLQGVNIDRRWMLYQLLRLIEDIPGDTAECGVYKGAGSYLICKMNALNIIHQRNHFIFDSFAGLSEPEAADGKNWSKGDLSYAMDRVKANLTGFEKVSLHQGWIPERFQDAAQHSFALVHIDVDLYQPTLDSMEFFYPRVNHGGIIVCDDYGLTTCPGSLKAVDEFLQDKPEKMLAMSGGGGFLIRGCKTSAALT